MYVRKDGSLGAALTASTAMQTFCRNNPTAEQCQPKGAVTMAATTAATTVSSGWSAHWGLILGAAVAVVVVYKIAT